MAKRRRLARALASGVMDLSTGGIGSLALKVGRDAAPKESRKTLAHPQEQRLSEVVELLVAERGPERTCYLLMQAIHDVVDG